ncbi:MAG: class I SAM-dependent methyltransferase [Bryobacter sp.]|jgi:SAM-dependent methyltransferase|nr:class I SAM-dependent methyltransferase [Bryobacter sp. CoA8 C33]
MTSNLWAAGDFSRIAPAAQVVGELLCDEVPVLAGDRVLDVGCGSGNTALAAARRRCEAAGVDPVEGLLERARQRAAFEGLAVEFEVGAAEELPFVAGRFDVVLSTFGLIFSAEPEAAVAEAARVLRAGGALGLTSWRRGSLNDELFAECLAVRGDLAGLREARDWGREEHAVRVLSGAFAPIHFVARQFLARAQSARQWLEGMKQFLAPVHLAYQGLGEEAAGELDRRLLELGQTHNELEDGRFLTRTPYLEIHARRR